MPMEGMNVEAVRQLGRDLNGQANQLMSVSSRVDALVNDVRQNWMGPDAVAFVGWWRNEHRPKLQSLIDVLIGLGKAAANNADEQEQASGGGGSVGGAALTPSPQQAAAPDATPVTQPSDQAVRSGAVDGFVRNWQGKKIDYDGAYNAQCFDVFRQYNEDVLGLTRQQQASLAHTSDAASAIYSDYDRNGVSQFYDRIPYGQGAPQPGDVIVYGGTQYGHVAVITEVRQDGYSILEQNYKDPANPGYEGLVPAAVHSRPFQNNILGYLRPKAVQ